MKAPCYQCEERIVGCHTACGEYKTYRAQMDERIEEHRKESLTAGYQDDKVARIHKKLRRNGKL